MAKAFSSGLSSVLSGGADTIVARATGAGGGALAVVRVSGPDTARLARSVCDEIDMDSPWHASLVRLRDRDGQPMEDAVAVPYRAPRSYTGEDMLELMVHGSPWIVESLVRELVWAGGRHAAPGEFTQRAVANGKMDLIQAEAVNEIVHAETRWQAQLAREQLHGVLSREIKALREKLISLLAEIEGALDFEEQGATVSSGEIQRSVEDCLAGIDALLETIGAGVRIREGARVVIVGAPNSGKSTLFNTLLLREQAIVTAAPGTTRDVLEASLEIEGLPVVLVDTAGLRKATDPAEAEGIRRAEKEEARADLVLALCAAGDGGDAPPPGASARRLTIISKADLAEGQTAGALAVSCMTGQGLEQLRKEIHRRVSSPLGLMTGTVAINARHGRSLTRARRHINSAGMLPQEVAALEVRSALNALDEVLGTVCDQDVLDSVFSTFCVGK